MLHFISLTRGSIGIISVLDKINELCLASGQETLHQDIQAEE